MIHPTAIVSDTAIIADDVEIGANTTVDRGAIDDTVIGNGAKLDNQIQDLARKIRNETIAVSDASLRFRGSVTLRDKKSSETIIAGSQVLPLADYHWADTNRDKRIEDNEILEDILHNSRVLRIAFSIENKALFGLPGHPVSAAVAFDLFVLPGQYLPMLILVDTHPLPMDFPYTHMSIEWA